MRKQRSGRLIQLTFTVQFLSLLRWKTEAAECAAWRSQTLLGISFKFTSV